MMMPCNIFGRMFSPLLLLFTVIVATNPARSSPVSRTSTDSLSLLPFKYDTTPNTTTSPLASRALLTLYANVQLGVSEMQKQHPTARFVQLFGGYPLLLYDTANPPRRSPQTGPETPDPRTLASTYDSLNHDLMLLFELPAPNHPEFSLPLRFFSSNPGEWSDQNRVLAGSAPESDPERGRQRHRYDFRSDRRVLVWGTMVGQMGLDEAIGMLTHAKGVFSGIEDHIWWYSVFQRGGELADVLPEGIYYEFHIARGFGVKVVYVSVFEEGRTWVDPKVEKVVKEFPLGDSAVLGKSGSEVGNGNGEVGGADAARGGNGWDSSSEEEDEDAGWVHVPDGEDWAFDDGDGDGDQAKSLT